MIGRVFGRRDSDFSIGQEYSDAVLIAGQRTGWQVVLNYV